MSQDPDAAAAKIQALQRGKIGRNAAQQKKVNSKEESGLQRIDQPVMYQMRLAPNKVPTDLMQDESAIKIQALQRGRLARKEVRDKQGNTPRKPEAGPKAADPSTPTSAVPTSPKSPRSPRTGAGVVVTTTPSGKLAPLHEVILASDIAPFRKDLSHALITDHQIRELFEKYDVNGNGYLSKKEMRAVYRSAENFGLPPKRDDIDRAFNQFDSGGDGKISYTEFAILMLKLAAR
eukprot:NODE_1324_length_1006_cov_60.892372_g1020_i0.p1 GENE.NODE_1324_length_1006_cov_60.892372_g1020_i0~~NODE_1324_length_1006_cov_60.892372_g1020_i0.p1  ORF type:complete len:234 (+),score=42.86 NODE_1324_length_1006_cov_60.892372_g1020_i0:65-766(+)